MRSSTGTARLDVVVNNAGGSPYVLTADSSAKFNRKIIELNLIGALSVSQHANDDDAKPAAAAGRSSTSAVSAADGPHRAPPPTERPRRAWKASRATLAVEWGPKVRVNACVVGMVETEQSELFYGDAESIAAISKNVPLGRLAKPDDVGWAAAFLASDAASYISGATWRCTGAASHRTISPPRARSSRGQFRTDFIVGKTEAVDELFAEGFQAIFLGTGTAFRI